MKARSLLVAALALPCIGLFGACGTDPDGNGSETQDPDSGFGRGDSGQKPDDTDGASSSGGSSGTPPPDRCATHFSYKPATTDVVDIVRVTGEWNAFATNGPELVRQADGSYQGDVVLPPGRIGYKLLVNGTYILDPGAPFHKFVGGEENSAVDVSDCELPTLRSDEASRDDGGFHTLVHFSPGRDGSPVDEATVTGTLRKDFEDAAPVAFSYFDDRNDGYTFFLDGLTDGKYTLFVNASDQAGHAAKPLRLVFWVENGAFEWQGTVIYMGMNDRVKNGDPSNDGAQMPSVDPRAQFQGGDLDGMRQLIASGYLDQLGVGAIWLSPFNVNPIGAFAGSGNHDVTGYHGYWPIRGREVDSRLGGATALRALVKEAHAHGIRVLQDFVLNHVHEQHEYVQAHPDWFRTACVCGTNGCDWTARRLDCLFTPYLPDVNWSVSELSQQMEQDAAWWVDQFDLDGLRVDAVKHVEDLAVINLSSALRGEFEASGQKLFLTGETAMGWNDCGTPGCIGNEENYGTISRYIGPRGLDGQFDFVLYHAASLNTFGFESKSLYHADYWTNASQITYPAGSIMTPYIGSHDTARFVSYAQYGNGDVPGRQWDDVAVAPSSATPYERERLALAWLFSLPGAPLLYYGDEYGEWGGSDPNNRHFFRDAAALDANETATLTWTRKLGAARRELVALRRGRYMLTPFQNDNLSVTVRRTEAGETAVVLLARTAQTITVTLPFGAELPNGTLLRDRLNGGTATVQGNAFSFSLPAHGAAYLAPN